MVQWSLQQRLQPRHAGVGQLPRSAPRRAVKTDNTLAGHASSASQTL